jgi:hypothetical protein
MVSTTVPQADGRRGLLRPHAAAKSTTRGF